MKTSMENCFPSDICSVLVTTHTSAVRQPFKQRQLSMHSTKCLSLSDPAASFPFLSFDLAFSPHDSPSIRLKKTFTIHLMFTRSTIEINYASGWAILVVMRVKESERPGETEWKRKEEGETSEGGDQCVIFRTSCLQCIRVHTGQRWSGVMSGTIRFTSYSKDSSQYFFPSLSWHAQWVERRNTESPSPLPPPHSQVKQEGEDRKEHHIMNTVSILLFRARRRISHCNAISETASLRALDLWGRCITLSVFQCIS